MNTLIILGIFSGIKAWGLGIIGGLGIVMYFGRIIDFIAKSVKKIAAKLKNFFGKVEETAIDVDDSIDDNTGKVSFDKKDEIVQDFKEVGESAVEIGVAVKEVVTDIKSFKK